jgi:hypothetical protein
VSGYSGNDLKVYTNLDTTWTSTDLSAPQPINNFYQPSASIDLVYIDSGGYYCIDLDLGSSNQKQFYDLSDSERMNGLLLIADFSSNNDPSYYQNLAQFDVSNNLPYLQFISCSFVCLFVYLPFQIK